MDALTILYYGHETVQKAVARINREDWEHGGVCGVWTAKDVMGHLGVYELLLVDVLRLLLDENADTPYLGLLVQGPPAFNDAQAALRKDWPVDTVLDEYHQAHEKVMTLARQIPPDLWPKPGTLPWYGAEYSLDDLVVYNNYAHKREHCAQLDAQSDHLS